MKTSQEQYDAVCEFMRTAGQTVATEFTFQRLQTANFRIALIQEELYGKNELFDCAAYDDDRGILDGICDVLFVTYGALAAYGLPASFRDFDLVSTPHNSRYAHVFSFWNRELSYGFEQFKRGISTGDEPTITAGLHNLAASAFDMAKDLGYDLPAAFDEVYRSNMSKFCHSEQHAIDSIAAHRASGDKKYDEVHYVQVGDKWCIRANSNGKALKGSDFFEPDLTKYI